MQSHVPGHAAGDLVDVHVQHHLRAGVAQSLQQAGGCVHDIVRRPHHDRAGARLGIDHANFQQGTQHVHDVIEFLGLGEPGQVEGAQRHALKLPAVLRRLSQHQDLPRFEGRPESVGHLTGGFHGGVEVGLAEVEPHLAGNHRLVKDRAHAEGGSDQGEQTPAVAAVVKIGPGCVGNEAQLSGIGHDLRRTGGSGRPFRHRVAQALQGKEVPGIQLQGATEGGEGLDLAALEHFPVALFDAVKHHLLARHFARGKVVDLARRQPGGSFELLKGFLQPPLALEA